MNFIRKICHQFTRHARPLFSFHSEPASEDHDEAQRARMYVQPETFQLLKRRANILAERYQAEAAGDLERAIECGWQAISISQQIMAHQEAGERIDISLLDWRVWQHAIN